MKKIIPLVVCAVFLISVKSECDDNDSKCADKIVEDILKDTSVVENIDIKLQVPKFEQIKNVGIEDLNQILLHLTSWFESRLNETNFIFKHVNNKTKIFVKSFDFNVDFEKGNAKIDVDLTEEPQNNKQVYHKEVAQEKEYVTEMLALENVHRKFAMKTTTVAPTTTTPAIITTAPVVISTTDNNTKELINKHKHKTDRIDRIISKLGSEKENEIFKLEEFDTSYYDVDEENSTDYPIIDYVEMYKDTTNEENVYSPTELPTAIEDIITGIYEVDRNDTERSIPPKNNTTNITNTTSSTDPICHGDVTCKNFAKTVFPWVVTIFVTNNTKDSQFSYYCDGALLTEKVIVTDARCMFVYNMTWEPDNVLVFLGKGNLQSFGGDEKVHKIREIIIHPNFTVGFDGKVVNDLALLVMEEPAVFKDNIQAACIHQEGGVEEAATTAWGLNGSLIPIIFNQNKSENCYNKDEDVFCTTYGNEVALCPSYGGIYVTKLVDHWCLQGIFYGDPADRGLCFSKDVYYTSLKNYLIWIDETVGMYKHYIL